LFFQPLDLASWGDHCLRRQKIHTIFYPRIGPVQSVAIRRFDLLSAHRRIDVP